MATDLGLVIWPLFLGLMVGQLYATYRVLLETEPPVGSDNDHYNKYVLVSTGIAVVAVVLPIISSVLEPSSMLDVTWLSELTVALVIFSFFAVSLYLGDLRLDWLAGSIVGIITLAYAATTSLPTNGAILAGAIVAAVVGFIIPTKSNFAATVAGYFLGSAAVFFSVGSIFPDVYSQDVFVGMVLFGSVSGTIVTVRWAIGRAITSFLEDYVDATHANRLWEFISVVIGLLLIIWTFLTAQEKLARYGGSAGVGSATFALNLLGIELPIPVWFLEGVDASIVLFIGSVAIGFHVLDTLYTAWYLAKSTTEASAKAGKTVLSAEAAAASAAVDKATEAGIEAPSMDLTNRLGSDEPEVDSPSQTSDQSDSGTADTSSVERISPIEAVENLEPVHFHILGHLADECPVSVDDLAARTGHDVYTTANKVQNLEEADIVEVAEDKVRPTVDAIEFEPLRFDKVE